MIQMLLRSGQALVAPPSLPWVPLGFPWVSLGSRWVSWGLFGPLPPPPWGSSDSNRCEVGLTACCYGLARLWGLPWVPLGFPLVSWGSWWVFLGLCGPPPSLGFLGQQLMRDWLESMPGGARKLLKGLGVRSSGLPAVWPPIESERQRPACCMAAGGGV